MSKVSFIVPAYNVEKYIEKCIKSIISQSVDKEVLIINDGSTDNTLHLCNELKKKYNEIKVISQVNAGLSAARNTGYKEATGDYIWFIDSDDYLEKDCAEKLVKICDEYQLDFIRGQYKVLDDINNNIIDKYPKECNASFCGKVLTGMQLMTNLLDNQMYEVTAWLGLYRTNYLRELELDFVEGVTYEDHEYLIKAFLGKEINRVMYVELPIYIYRQRPQSITKTYKLSDIDSFVRNISSMNLFVSKFYENKEWAKFKVGKQAISALYYQMTRVYGGLNRNDKKIVNISLDKKLKFEAFSYALNRNQKMKIFLFNYFRITIDIFYCLKRKRRTL